MIDGTFNLKTEKGNIPLKITKRAIYNFEKDRNASLLSFFVSGNDPENLTPDWRNIMRFDVQIDLAFACLPERENIKKDDLIEIADSESLLNFVTFVVEQYSLQINTEDKKSPLPEEEVPKSSNGGKSTEKK